MAAPSQLQELLQLSDDTVTLVVGPDARKLVIHHSVIARASPVLAAAFGSSNSGSSTWKEGEERTMTLMDDDVDAMQILLHFAYSDQLPKHIILPAGYVNDDHPGLYTKLAEACCLGEKYQNRRFNNAIASAITANCSTPSLEAVHYYPGSISIGTIYDGTCVGSKVRKLMVDL